jgi:hypothetical protein
MPKISVYLVKPFSSLDFRLTMPAFAVFLTFRLSSGNRPPDNLSFLLLSKERKTQRYANQPESVDVRVADDNSDGGGNAPFFS